MSVDLTTKFESVLEKGQVGHMFTLSEAVLDFAALIYVPNNRKLFYIKYIAHSRCHLLHGNWRKHMAQSWAQKLSRFGSCFKKAWERIHTAWPSRVPSIHQSLCLYHLSSPTAIMRPKATRVVITSSGHTLNFHRMQRSLPIGSWGLVRMPKEPRLFHSWRVVQHGHFGTGLQPS